MCTVQCVQCSVCICVICIQLHLMSATLRWHPEPLMIPQKHLQESPDGHHTPDLSTFSTFAAQFQGRHKFAWNQIKIDSVHHDMASLDPPGWWPNSTSAHGDQISPALSGHLLLLPPRANALHQTKTFLDDVFSIFRHLILANDDEGRGKGGFVTRWDKAGQRWTFAICFNHPHPHLPTGLRKCGWQNTMFYWQEIE